MHALHPNVGSFASNLRHAAARSHRRIVAASEASTSSLSPTSVSATSASSSKVDTIYIGFPKGDYDRSDGRKGRVIEDDPTKYPGKESYGLMANASGGWAGGEAALKDGSLDGLNNKIDVSQLAESAKKSTVSLTKSPGPDKEVIYLGYGKEPEDFAMRSAGIPGKAIVVSKEEARLYPGKEDVGFMLGATGGFPGGEAGLQQYLQTGELRLRDPRVAGRKQFSILAFVGAVALAGVGGSILLTDAFDVGNGLVASEVKPPAAVCAGRQQLCD